jgi:hypothetical protein
LYFGNQYDPATGDFDAAIDNGEDFNKTNIWTFDAGWGAFYEFKDLRKIFNPFIGLSIFHATNPNISFYGVESKYPVKFNIYSGVGFNLNESFQISPRVLMMRQANREMIDFGLFYYFNPSYSKYGYIFGVLYNTNDNMTFHLGIRSNSNIYRISYGFNTSIQDRFNSARNDFEISVIIARPTNAKPSYK